MLLAHQEVKEVPTTTNKGSLSNLLSRRLRSLLALPLPLSLVLRVLTLVMATVQDTADSSRRRLRRQHSRRPLILSTLATATEQ